jgi:hypothetical protein
MIYDVRKEEDIITNRKLHEKYTGQQNNYIKNINSKEKTIPFII